jgi:hypothetical protein
MNMLRGLAAVAVFAGAAVGAAVPAQAQTPVFQGVYNYVSEGKTGTWDIYPTCVPVVGDLREALYLPVGCVLHVSPSGGLTGGDARLVGGMWTFSSPKPKGMQCPDGSWEPTVEVIKFNETSGTRSISHTGNCGMAPGIISTPFTLSFNRPLPFPVDEYPLICEPGGLRRCF